MTPILKLTGALAPLEHEYALHGAIVMKLLANRAEDLARERAWAWSPRVGVS
jgi:hypothetical protein